MAGLGVGLWVEQGRVRLGFREWRQGWGWLGRVIENGGHFTHYRPRVLISTPVPIFFKKSPKINGWFECLHFFTVVSLYP